MCDYTGWIARSAAGHDKGTLLCVVGVDQEACRNCKLCIGTGCPALYAKDGKVHIDQDACNGCGVCMQVCPFDAIKMADGKAGAKA